MNDLLRFALLYLKMGWAIFPLHNPVPSGCSCGQECSSPAKHPRTKNGVLDASKDPDQIEAWWERWPKANIGLATGPISDLWVLDLDDPGALIHIERDLEGPLPNTLICQTARGLHYYFRWSPGVKNRAKLYPGLDVRGEGGYVIAPPSLHPLGVVYDWASTFDAIEAPKALLELVLSLGMEPKKAPSPPLAVASVSPGELNRYQEKALQSAIQNVASAPEGSRNDTLNREAYSVAGLGIDTGTLWRELAEAARTAGLPEKEITKTLRSALPKGEAKPRTIEPLKKNSKTNGSPPKDQKPQEEPEDPDIEFYKLTDTGNAERLANRHGQNLRYLTEGKTWYIWDGQRWAQDRTDHISRLAKETIREGIPEEAERCPSEEGKAKLLTWAHKSESAERRGAMEKLAAKEEGLQLLPEQLDADPWRLTCLNGVLDLKTGLLCQHRREDYATKLAPVLYDADVHCPKWMKFLHRAMGDKPELVSFLQRALGYSLTGDTREHCLFFLHGSGNNGKSTFLETCRALFSDYGQKAAFDTFLAKQSEGPRNDLARLRGARLVTASEAEGGKRFAEALLKEITGGDTISARFLHHEFFEFKPQFKIWLAANDKPIIKGTDHGIWRRIRLIPFTVKIPDEEIDKSLPDQLREELPGIFSWIVEGCLQWQKVGLGEPPEVKQATQAYREEMDVLADFIEAKCRLGIHEEVGARTLYKEYKTWAVEQAVDAITETAFGRNLSGRGLAKRRTSKGNLYAGIGLQSQPSQGGLSV